jgi:hypothetical protein
MPHPAATSVAWRRRDSTLTRRTPRAVLIMPEASSEPLRLEGPAALVWDGLDVPRTDADLVATIATQTGALPAAITAEVVGTRVALTSHGAVTAVR